jgi:hypothetical protein
MQGGTEFRHNNEEIHSASQYINTNILLITDALVALDMAFKGRDARWHHDFSLSAIKRKKENVVQQLENLQNKLRESPYYHADAGLNDD